MKLTGENRSTRKKTCPSASLSTTNPTWTDPWIELGPPRLEVFPLMLVRPAWIQIFFSAQFS
jgi:hypothetical protein